MRIAIGAPGNGALLKDALEERLAGDGRVSDLVDLSTPDITYPEVSFQVAQAVAEGRADRGVLIAAPAAWALIDIWLDLRHDPASSYGPKVGEIAAYEARLHS